MYTTRKQGCLAVFNASVHVRDIVNIAVMQKVEHQTDSADAEGAAWSRHTGEECIYQTCCACRFFLEQGS
jgi:hypothetical protein